MPLAARLAVPFVLASVASSQSESGGCRFPLPLPTEIGTEAFERELYAFLDARCYASLDWMRDAEVRDTGPWIDGSSYGSHPAVRIYYSPEVADWLRAGRVGPVRDGGVVVKEMYAPPASAGNPLSGWTFMVKDSKGSFDGWFWGYHGVDDDDDAPQPDTEDPDSGFGLYCLNCHASADNTQSTFSSLRNVEGDPLSFLVVDPTMHAPRGATESLHRMKASLEQQTPIARHRGRPDPEFLRLFDQMPPVPLGSVAPFPGETLDHVLSGPAGPPQFLTSDQCISCHDATQSNAAPPNMIYPADGGDGAIVNLSPYGEWRASMMGLAGRDPIFFAQLESELAIHPTRAAEIQDLCFHCHGVMGQRQLALDSDGDRTFTRALVDAVPPGHDATYGALARDGVSCTACHHVTPEGLGTPASFTGNFVAGPADELYGPYEEVATLPMERALGITPHYGGQIQSAALCGSCHAILLPVFDAQGRKVKETFEQTTYLEPRQPYSRHTLYGINLFGIEMFQQYAELLGIRTVDPMATYGDDRPGLETAERAGVELATESTARVTIRSVARDGDALECAVEVENLAGHHFPSGVGFRRAFLCFEVLDAQGAMLWASGRSSDLGVLLGPDGAPLPSEFFERVDGAQAYQPHHERIERQDQVQVYEELVRDCEGAFTTSFLSICRHVKDNRLQPRGWTASGPYAADTRPWGAAERDCDYRFQPSCAEPSAGTDALVYRVPAAGAASLRVTLYYQAIPPYYLA